MLISAKKQNKKISRPIWSVCEHGRTRNWHYM